ncbi:transposase [Rhodobacteraceae bacterium PD-2]|nr:transposase [Rhodobacteraceae bacterium PD-2]
MKASKFADAQKAFILKQAEDEAPVVEVCHKAGNSTAAFFNWKKAAGLMPSEIKRLREREQENARLKNIVANLAPDKEMVSG